MNQWEVCPKCKGEGIYNTALSYSTGTICGVCCGAMIINSFTGQPPKRIKVAQIGISNDIFIKPEPSTC